MNTRNRWLAIGLIAVLFACVGTCAAVGLAMRYSTDIYVFLMKQGALRAGAEAPDFSLESLDGAQVRLSELRGRPVMLTFATSWCPACRDEAPRLETLHTQHPELMVVLVDSNETDEVVRGFAAEFGMTHTVLLDGSGLVSNRYRVFAIPTTFFIDRDGIIRAVVIDEVTQQAAAEKLPLVGIEP
jgi:cytochrome c biogenesis protein CcmG/thiol:disulfide interchange protein DsbE